MFPAASLAEWISADESNSFSHIIISLSECRNKESRVRHEMIEHRLAKKKKKSVVWHVHIKGCYKILIYFGLRLIPFLVLAVMPLLSKTGLQLWPQKQQQYIFHCPDPRAK